MFTLSLLKVSGICVHAYDCKANNVQIDNHKGFIHRQEQQTQTRRNIIWLDMMRKIRLDQINRFEEKEHWAKQNANDYE